MTKKYLVKFSYQKHACPVEEVLFEDRDSIVVKFTDTHDGVKDTYSHAFVKDTEGGFLSVVDTAGGSSSLEEIVSRAVPEDKRLDFTKPIEIYFAGDTYPAWYPCKFLGEMHGKSNNFMSWFVVEVPHEGTIKSYILVRGDGKTDVPGATVRNVVEATKPKLVLPIQGNRYYKFRNGKTAWISTGFANPHKSIPWNPIGFYNVATGKNTEFRDHDLIEGPL